MRRLRDELALLPFELSLIPEVLVLCVRDGRRFIRKES